jgi:valyl-tRNA synthetase
VEPGKKVAAMIQVSDPAFRAELEKERDILALLGRLDGGKLTVGDIEGMEGGKEGGKAVRLIVEDGLECYLPLADLVDAQKEKERLRKEYIEELKKRHEEEKNRLESLFLKEQAGRREDQVTH